jgi:hypothetical protein
MLHHVKDLSPDQKHAIENLLGHPVSEDESVSIKNIRPSAIIPPQRRQRSARRRLRSYAGILSRSLCNEFL